MQIPRKEGKNSFKWLMFKILIITQLLMLIATSLHTRTPLIWIWAISSFIPPAIVCVLTDKKRFVIPSLLLLYISQHAIFVFSQSPWGYNSGSDPINDLHVATVLSEEPHFTLGQVGYASRLSYSYYPLLHIFTVILSRLSGAPLSFMTVYFVPFVNSSLVCLFLYLLNKNLFGLYGRERGMATLLFGLCWYYTFFQSAFVRESFAFPLVLITLWIFMLIEKRPKVAWAALLPITFVAVILSHHISSYMFLAIIMLLALCYRIFYGNDQLSKPSLLMVVMLFAYISFVVMGLFSQQVKNFYNAFLEISLPGSTSIMRPYPVWRTYLARSYYMLIIIFAFIGGLKLLRNWRERRNFESITIILFSALIFLLCTLLRLSISAHPWSWTYYMSLRGITWAFIGISILILLGVKTSLNLNLDNRISRKKLFVVILIICVLAAGKFSQYPLKIDNPAITPSVTFQWYIAALWLRNETVHGSYMLVAPYTLDMEAFEASRSIAPYAYLKEYFLDEIQYKNQYEKLIGYIPFVGNFYDQYEGSCSINIFYDNGEAKIGYKSLHK
ncbi:MAG: hypothetical protein QXF61_10240 [Nitrososphaeria archaeon]